ncbi:DNA cytosine methyltransferase [Burkholderia stagnalis]|uniref:DNA cytosine methyltransferase n=1 Tax=Burkholderia stagnalis TaxID=1503054 RepID=UPI0009BEEB23|nr:DNA cytosine methyltransferase [Burkholderia stagnalis]
MNKNKPTVIDLFCGCGGFSLGAELAGFQSIVAIDIEPTLQSSFGRNFPLSKPVQANVADINRTDWNILIGSQRPDGIIGGPPCQGFSRIGKRSKDDPRNTLIHHFYRHILLLQPKFFVMENVEGLLDEDNIGVLETAIETVKHRYTVLGPFVINAADFGAATNRRRAVVVGYDSNELALGQHLFDQVAVERKATVRDAISDLSSPVPRNLRDKSDFGWASYHTNPIATVSEYARSLRQLPPKNLGWPDAIERLSSGMVSGMFETRHTATVAKRYGAVPNGASDKISKSYRLSWDGQCPTIRAGTGSEKGAFQAVRPLHPSEPRVITVREAARMQAFPDWFIFHPTVWHSFRMIGNSVSPSVSFGILSTILKNLNRNESPSNQLGQRAA